MSSIYTNEGVPMMAAIELAIRDTIEDVTTAPLSEDSIQVCRKPLRVPICTIRPHGAFGVDVVSKYWVHYASPLSAILARVRKLVEAARETPTVAPETPEQIENARNKIPEKLTTGLVKPVEEAPAEPTLREFLVEFRKWVKGEGDYEVGGCVADRRLAEWIDARLGKEESDG